MDFTFGAGPQDASGTYALPSDRQTSWSSVGVTYGAGGIPARSTIYTTLSPSGGDDTSAIQAAIDACPAGQTVKLNPGTFLINGASPVNLKSNVTLRGSGAGTTTLSRTANGQAIFNTNINGTELLNAAGNGIVGSYTNVSGTVSKGATSITVSGASAATLFANYTSIKYVVIDHVTAATNVADPQNFAHGDGVFSNNSGNVWRSPDSEVFWPDRDASGTLPWYVDVYFRRNSATDGTDARPQGEIKEIASMTDLGGGSYRITFTSPLHRTFTATRLAQVAWFTTTWVEGVGVEDMTLRGGGRGNVRFSQCAKSWMARVESCEYKDPSLYIYAGFRCEIRDSYVHDTWYAYNGGGGYGTAFDYYTSELLFENNIVVKTAKPMVFRSSGAGSVVGYNYVDAQFEGSNYVTWQEVGINGSHMVGGYQILFEGNWSQNFDADKRWGPSDYMVVFRNYLRGRNALTFTWPNALDGGTATITETTEVNGSVNQAVGPQRCGGAQAWSYWLSFVGNVMGKSGAHSGWLYETEKGISQKGIWSLGWDDVYPYGNPADPSTGAHDTQVTATALRDGNYDYLTGQVHWHGIGGSGAANDLTPPSAAILPSSLYLSGKPSWFGSNTWPWVDATGTTKTATLPAKARYDAGTPNTV